MNQIVLFYKYIHISDTEALKKTQKTLLESLNMKGRLIIAHEGINGTFEGSSDSISKYIDQMKTDTRFSDIHWKISNGTENGDAFPKLSVKVRAEIVSLHLYEADIDPNQVTGIHLKPDELRKWYNEGKEFYIVDMRNDYELKVGKFENTIFPGMSTFRDLRDKVGELENLKNKTVLTVCTGGVRCEKASGFLKTQGFENVYQLDGGIVSYMEKYPGLDFAGSLYVFDQRITMNFDKSENHTVIGECEVCDASSERYINCANLACHRHFICCENCNIGNGGYCSNECSDTSSTLHVN